MSWPQHSRNCRRPSSEWLSSKKTKNTSSSCSPSKSTTQTCKREMANRNSRTSNPKRSKTIPQWTCFLTTMARRDQVSDIHVSFHLGSASILHSYLQLSTRTVWIGLYVWVNFSSWSYWQFVACAGRQMTWLLSHQCSGTIVLLQLTAVKFFGVGQVCKFWKFRNLKVQWCNYYNYYSLNIFIRRRLLPSLNTVFLFNCRGLLTS